MLKFAPEFILIIHLIIEFHLNICYAIPISRKTLFLFYFFITENIIVALLSLLGTCVGAFGGVLASSKLTNYRIKKLEEKVDKHNSFAERIPVLKEQIKVLNHRMEDIETLCNFGGKM